MRIGEIIQRIEAALTKSVKKSDFMSYIPRPWIYNIIVSARSRLIGQKINKKQFIPSFNKQTLTCIPLVKVNDNDCDCDGGVCKILRTEDKLPDIMSGLSDYSIENINSNGVKIPLVKPNHAKYSGYSKYTGTMQCAYIQNGYLYVKGINFGSNVNITALFEDPVEAVKWNNRNTTCKDSISNICDIMGFEFPIDNDMVDIVVALAINEIINGMQNQKPQNKEDNREEQENE